MPEAPAFAHVCTNLADPQVGAAVIAVSDEFFAPAKRMLLPEEPVFLPDRFDDHGKWMDGWESRRRRDSGFDHCIVRICPGVISGIDIDTRHFIGNYPAEVRVEACRADGDPDGDCHWVVLAARHRLGPDSHHFFTVDSDEAWTHLRLSIFPDGGIARLRVYGQPEHAQNQAHTWTDLVASSCGGRAVYCNDMHFGHMDNLLAPNVPASMADGWETRRRREQGNDFVILALGQPGRIHRAEIDTAWFRGNYPARVALRGAAIHHAEPDPELSAEWPLILPPMALGPDQLQVFEQQICDAGNVSHVRMDIFPDGGIARIRLLGEPSP